LEFLGVAVETGYIGSYVGRYDSERSARSNKDYVAEGKTIRSVIHPHVELHKPHGSLDWYVRDSEVIRSPVSLDLPRAIITPGLSKYKAGYETQYDQQRSAAARSLEKAPRVLAIGYGFNDDQLEHSWCNNLSTDKRVIIITKDLTPNALNLVRANKSVLALSSDPSDASATLVFQGTDVKTFSKPIWMAHHFVLEVIR
jgi:hypothetical protein